MADRARQLLRVDARQSLALSEIAIVAARLLRDRLAMAHAVRIKANAKYALDEHRAALKLYNQAIRSFEAGGDRTELGRTLSVSILSLTLCGQYDAAFAAAAARFAPATAATALGPAIPVRPRESARRRGR